MRSHAPCVAPPELEPTQRVSASVARGAYRGGSRFLLSVCPSHTNRVFGGRPTSARLEWSPRLLVPGYGYTSVRRTDPRGATVGRILLLICARHDVCRAPVRRSEAFHFRFKALRGRAVERRGYYYTAWPMADGGAASAFAVRRRSPLGLGPSRAAGGVLDV